MAYSLTRACVVPLSSTRACCDTRQTPRGIWGIVRSVIMPRNRTSFSVRPVLSCARALLSLTHASSESCLRSHDSIYFAARANRAEWLAGVLGAFGLIMSWRLMESQSRPGTSLPSFPGNTPYFRADSYQAAVCCDNEYAFQLEFTSEPQSTATAPASVLPQPPASVELQSLY